MNRSTKYWVNAIQRSAVNFYRFLLLAGKRLLQMLVSPKKTLKIVAQHHSLGWGAMIIVLLALAGARMVYINQVNYDFLFFEEVVPDTLPDQLAGFYEDVQIEMRESDLSTDERLDELKTFAYSLTEAERIDRPYSQFEGNYRTTWFFVALSWVTWLMIVASALRLRKMSFTWRGKESLMVIDEYAEPGTSYRPQTPNKRSYLQWLALSSWVLAPLVLQSIWFAINALFFDGHATAKTLQPLTFSNYLPEYLYAGFPGLFSAFMLWSTVLLAMLWRYVAKVSWIEAVFWALVLGFLLIPISSTLG